MIVDKKIETLEHSSVKLTITIDANSVSEEYKNLLNKYVKTAQVKGFRKGKAPIKILEQKYGEAIKGEATINLMESSLQQAYEEIEKKPLPVSQTVLQEEDKEKLIEIGKDFTFTVIYDTMPEVKVENYKGIALKTFVCEITKKDIDAELEKLREQNSMVTEKSGGKAEKGDIVNIDFCKLDDNENEIEKEKREDFVFTIGSEQNLYKIDDDIIGMAVNEEKIVNKEYPNNYENSELAGKKLKLKIKLNSIKIKELPKLDDELAQDINDEFSTLKDLKASIKKDLTKKVENIIDNKNKQFIIDKLIESTKVDLPESIISTELSSSWNNFILQSRITEEQVLEILKSQEKDKETLLQEWKPSVEKNIKQRLIVRELSEKEKINYKEEDLKEAIQREADASGVQYEDAEKYFKSSGMINILEENLLLDKVLDFLLASAEIQKGEKKDYLDLLKN